MLWRTDVNKAITLVRAAVEKKAAAKCQSLARMLLASQLTETMYALRADLRRAIQYNGDDDREVRTWDSDGVVDVGTFFLGGCGREHTLKKTTSTSLLDLRSLHLIYQLTNTPIDFQVTEVERLLKESKDAPFQMREHYLLSDKFKIIIKRRRVAASIDGINLTLSG